MKESNLCTEIVRSINRLRNSFAYKIPDISGMQRATSEFNPPRCFDILAVHGGVTYALEAKLIKSPTTLHSNRFTEFEARSLDAVERAGGYAYVAACYFFTPTDKQEIDYDIRGVVNELYFIPYYAMENAWREGKYTYEWIRDSGYVKFSKSKDLWDIDFSVLGYDSCKTWKKSFKTGKI